MEDSILIVGLGNPGEEYSQTRHNAGFMVLDRLAGRDGGRWEREKKFSAKLAWIEIDGRRVLLCKPQTYMNLSGQAVAPLMRFYRIREDRMLVVVDDADLPVGGLRMRPKGSSGGHHGLDSLNQHLGSTGYARQKIGIGRRGAVQREITGHVLGRFAPDEGELMDKVFERACDQIICWVRHGIEMAMNQYNGALAGSAE